MEFPALVYRSASAYLLVQDAAEHAAALADGWFATVPEALAPKFSTITPLGQAAPSVEVKLPDARTLLEAQAHALGISFRPQLGDKKLAERIAEALSA